VGKFKAEGCSLNRPGMAAGITNETNVSRAALYARTKSASLRPRIITASHIVACNAHGRDGRQSRYHTVRNCMPVLVQTLQKLQKQTEGYSTPVILNCTLTFINAPIYAPDPWHIKQPRIYLRGDAEK
jgi:hypothetical protein